MNDSETCSESALHGAVIGVLIGFHYVGVRPLVIFPGQLGEAAITARAAVDVHGAHVGRQVVLVFEEGDSRRPIIVGLLQRVDNFPLPRSHESVEVESDGERLIISAREELLLRCGRASVTLTKTGKVIVQGTYVSQRSEGVMRIKGGTIQLN